MNIEAIKARTLEKYPEVYTEENIEGILQKIEDLPPELREGLDKFLETGETPDIEVEGWTVEKLKEERGLNEIASILALDWLGREPEKAKETLKRGFDRIVIDPTKE